MNFFLKLFKHQSKESTIQLDYEKAMKSLHIDFIQEVLHGYEMEIGDNKNFHKLQQRLFRLQKEK